MAMPKTLGKQLLLFDLDSIDNARITKEILVYLYHFTSISVEKIKLNIVISYTWRE